MEGLQALFCGAVGMLIGITSVLFSWIMYDKHKEKQEQKKMAERIYNPDGFCYNGCKYYEEIRKEHKDLDEAMRLLDNEHCRHCPIYDAQDVLDWSESK